MENSCFFTGHRHLPVSKISCIQEELSNKIIELSSAGINHFISGGAIGFDMLCADTVIKLQQSNPDYAKKLRLSLFLPCYDQSKNWSQEDKFHLNMLIFKASDHRYITKGAYNKDCMKKRNFAMVNNALFGIAFCVKSYSGTAQTIRYADMKNRQVFNLADLIYK